MTEDCTGLGVHAREIQRAVRLCHFGGNKETNRHLVTTAVFCCLCTCFLGTSAQPFALTSRYDKARRRLCSDGAFGLALLRTDCTNVCRKTKMRRNQSCAHTLHIGTRHATERYSKYPQAGAEAEYVQAVRVVQAASSNSPLTFAWAISLHVAGPFGSPSSSNNFQFRFISRLRTTAAYALAELQSSAIHDKYNTPSSNDTLSESCQQDGSTPPFSVAINIFRKSNERRDGNRFSGRGILNSLQYGTAADNGGATMKCTLTTLYMELFQRLFPSPSQLVLSTVTAKPAANRMGARLGFPSEVDCLSHTKTTINPLTRARTPKHHSTH